MNVTNRTILALAATLTAIAAACGSMDEGSQASEQTEAVATAAHSPEPPSETKQSKEPTPEMDENRIAGNHCTEAQKAGEQEILRRHPDRDELKFIGFEIDSVDLDGKHRLLIAFLEPNSIGGFQRGIARFSVNNSDCAIKIVEVKY